MRTKEGFIVPLVSVIVPVYNAERYLRQCVRSVLQQTISDLEVILVDDGSKDDSLTICNDLAAEDPRVQVVSTKNGGAGAARNAGIAVATGTLLYFLDADDWVEPELLQRLTEKINLADEGTMAICARYIESADGSNRKAWLPVREGRKWQHENIADCVANLDEANVFNYVWDRLYFRSVLEKHNIRFETHFTTGEDLGFNLRYFRYVTRCELVMQPLYHYRTDNQNSLCARYKQRMYEIVSEQGRMRADFYREMQMTDDPRYQAILAHQYVAHLHACVPNMYRPNAKLSHRQRREIFGQLISDPLLKRYIPKNTDRDLYLRLFSAVIPLGSVWLADGIYSVLFFFRNHFSGAYSRWRRKTEKRS